MFSAASPNPYLAGPPLDGEVGFFGREDIIKEVEQTLRYPDRNSVILYGQRKIGKTSLLRQLERRLPAPPFFTVYFDLAGQELLPVSQVLHNVAAAAAQKADMPAPAPAEFRDNPDAFHTTFLPALYQKLGAERQPVFLIDEFKILSEAEQELPENAAIRALDDYFYKLLTGQTDANFVFTAGRRIEEISGVTRSTFKPDLVRFIPVLTPGQARALILQDGGKGSLSYDTAAVRRILALTGCQPYLTQWLCHALFERAIARSKRKPQVTVEDVNAILPDLMQAEDNGLAQLWETLPSPERVALAALAGQVGESHVFDEKMIQDIFREAGVSLSSAELRQAPENLVNWRILERTDGQYLFSVELMRRWIAQMRPLKQVQKETDPLYLAAEKLYQAAQHSHQAGNHKQAIDQLSQALNKYPDHLQARLLLGQILKERDQLTGALAEFEEVYKLDPEAARQPLRAALFQLGEALEEAGNSAQAMAVYDRALSLAPEDREALERRERVEAQFAARSRPAETPAEPLAEPKKTMAPVTRPQKDRRPWRWAAAAIAILLVLLLLVCGLGGYLPLGPGRDVATPTTGADVVSGVTGATVAGAHDLPQADQESNAPQIQAGEAITATAEITSQAGFGINSQPASAAGAQSGSTGSQPAGQIRVVGSTTMQPLIEALAAGLSAQRPDVQIVLQGGGSQAGLEAVRQGVADAGMVTRPLDAAESGDLQVFSLAQKDVIAIAVHPLVRLESLTTEQVQGIFAGQITNWAEINGPDAPILVVTRSEGSGTRSVFEQIIMGGPGLMTNSALEEPSDEAVRDTVASQPYAIGYLPLKIATKNIDVPPEQPNWAVLDSALLDVRLLALDGVPPTVSNALDGIYPLTYPFNIVTPAQPAQPVQDWLGFIFSPAGQQIIEAAGYTPLSP